MRVSHFVDVRQFSQRQVLLDVGRADVALLALGKIQQGEAGGGPRRGGGFVMTVSSCGLNVLGITEEEMGGNGKRFAGEDGII